MNKSETLMFLTLIQSYYENFMPKNHEAQKMVIELWTETLEEIDFEQAKAALKQHLKESVYTPKIADIYQRVVSKRLPNFPDPVEQYNTVIRAIGTYGYTQADKAIATFNPYTQKVVEMMGGFRKMCMAEVDEQMSDRKHFVETYNRLIDRETRNIKEGGAGVLQLIGEKKEPSHFDLLVNESIKRIMQ